MGFAVVDVVGPAPQAQPIVGAAVPVPAERPVQLEIPTIDVSVPVRPVGLTAEQHLEVPSYGEAGWYRPRPLPGHVGHAVIAGHVDNRKGPDVFYRLDSLRPGDELRVRMSTGSLLSFKVDELGRQPKDDLRYSPMWRATDRPQLVLLTCGGTFDRKRRTYLENLVVYATLAASDDGATQLAQGPPSDQSSGFSSTADPSTSPVVPSTTTRPRRVGGSSAE